MVLLRHCRFLRVLKARVVPKLCFHASAPFPEFAKRFPGYTELYDYSIHNNSQFWNVVASNRLDWMQPYSKVSDCDMSTGSINWFSGGKLNVSVNCVDRHLAKKGNTNAILWEKDEPGRQEGITYNELSVTMNRFANLFKSSGVKRGDRVALYMPVCPLLVAAMLACARIGAIHSVVFAGFSADALAARIHDAGCETVVTTDGAMRGGRLIPLKSIVDDAVKQCPGVRDVFVASHLNGESPDCAMTSRDRHLDRELDGQSNYCEPEVMDSEDPLFMLYTSGSTGKPKGVVHTQAGYLLYAALTHQQVFDVRDGDTFGCVADIGWITGHSYVVYGPLANGVTTVLFESVPTYPDPGRYWETVQRLQMDQIYLAPTALRLLIKNGDDWVKKYDRSSLRTLGCVGEPLNHQAWDWYYNVVGEGRCPIIDTWWQTETGGICIAPRPSSPDAEILAGMPMRPFYGMTPVIVDENGTTQTGPEATGNLCLALPWPGMARTLFGNHQRFVDTYYSTYPGLYFSGDGAKCHGEGIIQITGRVDDVINVSGHRIGTAEVEDALNSHPAVAESAVVGFPHDVKGEGIYAYTILKDAYKPSADLSKELKQIVKKSLAGYAVPDFIQLTAGLPKTRSGKIMRRILRKVAADDFESLGDTSTLADPTVVDAIIVNHKVLTSSQKTK